MEVNNLNIEMYVMFVYKSHSQRHYEFAFLSEFCIYYSLKSIKCLI